MASNGGRPEYTFDLSAWTTEVKTAVVMCPHAVTHDLTPWEIEVLDTNQMRKRALATDTENAIQVCLRHEFQYFKKLKYKISRKILTTAEFKLSSFNVAYAVLKNIFSANNPHLLYALLQLPERVQFTRGGGIAHLFGSRLYLQQNKVEKIFGMIRRRYAQRGLTGEENGVLHAYLRMASVRNPKQSPTAAGGFEPRGRRIGLAALHEALPLAGRHPGTAGAVAELAPALIFRRDEYDDDDGGGDDDDDDDGGGGGESVQSAAVSPFSNNPLTLMVI